MAFEVQLASISPQSWCDRHKEYSRIGVRDYWLLGLADLRRSRHALAGLLAAAEGQRLLYVGGETAEAVEKICQDPTTQPGGAGMSPPYLTVPYDLKDLRLSPDGRLSTPADVEQERRWHALERAQAAKEQSRAKPWEARPWARTSVSEEAFGQKRSGARPPQPMPAQLSERALKETPAWALEMHRQRQQIARQMAIEDVSRRSEN